MKISGLQTDCFRVPLPVTLSDSTHGTMSDFQLVTVRLWDEVGNEGLGYTYTVGSGGLAIRSHVSDDLQSLVIGSETSATESLWNRCWQHLHFVGRGGAASFALAAVDIAVWDLVARQQNLPLWKYLGGSGNRVPVYAGGINLNFSLSDLLAETRAFLEAGHRAIKMKVGRRSLDEDVQRVSAMREFLGADIPLMVDANMRWSTGQAVEAARALRQFDLNWLEEPIAPDDYDGHAIVAKEGLPIASGENLHSVQEFSLLIASKGVTYVEPDVATVGGITPWLKVAKLAEDAGLPVTSHGVHDLHVHLLAATPNSSYLESHGFAIDRFLTQPLRLGEGHAIAPDRPGHGVCLDWELLRQYEI